MTDATAALISQLGLSALAIGMLLGGALLFSSYIKVVTVLGILRVGLGFSGLPSAFVTGGLAVVLTFFVMFPTLSQSTSAIEEHLRASGGSVTDRERILAIGAGMEQWKQFLQRQATKEEVERFSALAKKLDDKVAADSAPSGATSGRQNSVAASAPDSWRVLAPAFLISELRSAFATGLTIFLPFLVIDLLVANILVAVGFERLSPVLVAFPVKLLVFVLLDGWALIAGNLVAAYAR